MNNQSSHILPALIVDGPSSPDCYNFKAEVKPSKDRLSLNPPLAYICPMLGKYSLICCPIASIFFIECPPNSGTLNVNYPITSLVFFASYVRLGLDKSTISRIALSGTPLYFLTASTLKTF